MSLPPRHKVAAGLMLAGFMVNLRAGQLGLRTICTAGRERARIDTPLGFVLSLAGIAATGAGFAIHFLDHDKWPVR